MAFAVRSAAAGKRRVAVSVASAVVIMLAGLMLVLPWQGAAPWAQGGSVGLLHGACPLQLCPPCAEGTAAQTSAATGLPEEEQQQQQAPEEQRDVDAATAEQQGDGEQPAAGPDDNAPAPPPAEEVLCGGPAAIPQPPVALAAAGQALQRSLDAAFARWKDTGFSVEDLMATADELGIDGTHDTHVWVEVGTARLHRPAVTSRLGLWPRSRAAHASPHAPPPEAAGAQQDHHVPAPPQGPVRLVLQQLAGPADCGVQRGAGFGPPCAARGPGHAVERV